MGKPKEAPVEKTKTSEKGEEKDPDKESNSSAPSNNKGKNDDNVASVPEQTDVPVDDTTNETDKPWDNTDRKVVIHNMYRFTDNRKGTKSAEQWAKAASTNDLTIRIYKVRKPPKDTFMVVTLMDPSMVQPYVDYINNNNIVNKHGGKLVAKTASSIDEEAAAAAGDDDPSNRKRKDRDDDGDEDGNTSNTRSTKKGIKRQQREQLWKHGRRPISEDEIRKKVTPLFNLSAEAQSERKQREMIKNCAQKMVKAIKARFRLLGQERKAKQSKGGVEPAYAWLERKRCIEVDPLITVPSPLRNKVEFTFGYRYSYVTETQESNGGASAAEDGADNADAMETSDEKVEVLDQKTAEQFDKKEEEKSADVEMSENVKESKEGETENETVVPIDETETKTDDADKASSKKKKPEITRVPSVGFMARGWSGGVAKPHCCANIPSEMCALADAMEDFLKDSPLAPYDSKEHQGFWRYLTVRTSRRTQQCMLIICHAPVTGGQGDAIDYTKDWESEKERLIATLQALRLPVRSETGDDLGITVSVTSMFFQEYFGLSSPPPEHPVHHAFGKTFLEEKLGKCTFQISHGSFFQVNTAGAEILYRIVMDKLAESLNRGEGENKKKVILFDVCCGTGTIGLSCLKEGVVDQVIGIDISQPAIEDAKRNSELNGFGGGETKEGEEDTQDAKTRFVASRAEYVMSKEIGRVLSKHKDATFLAVVDPARDGLHGKVVQALRGTEQIQRIVYVSCNPTVSLVRDATWLCAAPTKKFSGRAFRPTSACPVDMFPLTDHCEMVMTFDRVKDSDIGQVKDSDTDQAKDPDTDLVKDSDTDQVKDSDTDQVKDSDPDQVKDSDADQVKDSDTVQVKDSDIK